MKKIIALVSVCVLAACLSIVLCQKNLIPGRAGSGEENACVEQAAKQFTDHFSDGTKGVINFLNQDRQEKKSPQVEMRLKSPGKVAQNKLPFLQEEIVSNLREFACLFPPLKIAKAEVIAYPPTSADSPQAPNCLIPPHPRTDSFLTEKIHNAYQSVGKLEVFDEHNEEFWGTGFVAAATTVNNVRSGLIATTCHTIASISSKYNKKYHLKLSKGEGLKIAFSEGATCRINDIEACPDHPGVDVALLSVKDCADLPNALPFFDGQIDSSAGKPHPDLLALIGYGDLDHPIDRDTAELYSRWKEEDESHVYEFGMLDYVVASQVCKGPSGQPSLIYLDAASTTVGESGGILLDLDITTNDPNAQSKVIGVHTCCASYFSATHGTAPSPNIDCAGMKRTFNNQAASSQSILQDPALCEALKAYRAPLGPGGSCGSNSSSSRTQKPQ